MIARNPKVAIVVLMLLAALALTGCGNLLTSRKAPTVTYVLRPAFPTAQEVEGAMPSVARPVVQVIDVVAAPGYAGDAILATRPDRRLDFFAASRWPDGLENVVESLAVEALRRRGAEAHDAAAPVKSAFTVRLDLRRFDADYRDGAALPVIRIELAAVVGRRADRAVLGTVPVQVAVEASANRMSAIVAAFERAAGEALTATADGALRVIEAAPAGPTEGTSR